MLNEVKHLGLKIMVLKNQSEILRSLRSFRMTIGVGFDGLSE